MEMDLDASSVRTEIEFQFYFPNATFKSLAQYIKPIPLDKYRLILLAAFSTLFVVGVSANAWVARVVGIVLSQTRTQAPRAVQIFILALCGCDVFVLLFLCLLLIDLCYGQWVVQSTFLCQSYLMSESLSKFYAPFLLVELSGFCYLSVKRRRNTSTSFTSSTNSRRHSNTTKLALVSVILALALAFALMAPVYLYSDVYYLILHNASDIHMVQRKCAFQPPDYVFTAFTAYSFVCGYLVPAFLFTVFYAALLIHVHRRRRKSSCTTAKSLDYFSKVARTSLGLVLFYLLSWTPYWTMSLYQYLNPFDGSGPMPDAIVIISYFIHMLPYVNCNAYPLLYTLLNRSIQHDYLRACEFNKSQKELRRITRSSRSSGSRYSTLGTIVKSERRKSDTPVTSEIISDLILDPLRKISEPTFIQNHVLSERHSLILKTGFEKDKNKNKLKKRAFSFYNKDSEKLDDF